ncbi:condensation domain-containing protein [Mycolicibacterium insubricum]|uniref:condensation domain-containing protein n=1 Tax=Mycolicibacterium insubricum TaxID=444597 RepID=UPI001F46F653|nr:condensation domain-containing protein [Mycolicibacterium insubricum]
MSPIPVSYQQEQHLRAFRSHTARGTEMARLNIPAWDMPGRCDVRAMSHVINAYLRRHDTYHSWFEFGADDSVVRRTARSPRDITLVPVAHGELTAARWREHVLSTPGPLQWDCFGFGVIQRKDHFTFYLAIDHVHTDAMFMGLVLTEIHLMYTALVGGRPPIPLTPAGSYHDYCLRQRAYTESLSLQSPEVVEWIRFAQGNDDVLPHFPLPLGSTDHAWGGDLITVDLLDADQGARFESACVRAGSRFFAGVLACAALAETELTGRRKYFAITPTTTRRSAEEFMTTGWFTGLVPVTVEVTPDSFADTARSAQHSFDANVALADVPVERVLELAAPLGITAPAPGVTMVSFLDAGLPPLSPEIIDAWEGMNGKLFFDNRSAYQVGVWVNRTARRTTVTVAFPDNPVARASVTRYLEVLVREYRDTASGEGYGNGPSRAVRVRAHRPGIRAEAPVGG